MVMMNLFRMLADVSFYCAFAGLIARACGGTGAFWGMLIQCICFGISRMGGNRRMLRMVCLLPMLLCWVIHWNALADGILLIPTAAYIVWLVWKNDYALDHERQQVLFGVFWKVLATVVVFGFLLGGIEAITAITIPYALTMLMCSVLLMRALRHEPKVYCGVRYQIANLFAVVAVVAAAGLLSTKTVLNGCVAALKAAYSTLIQPILEFLLSILLYIMEGIAILFSWLSLKRESAEERETMQMDLTGAEEIFGENVALKEPGELLKTMGIVLLVAAAVVMLVLFFRWMSRRSRAEATHAESKELRGTVKVEQRAVKKKETSPVRKIRAQYRGFLKWCSGAGVQLDRSSTSLDVHRQVNAVSGRDVISEQIREVYIKARYARVADQDGVRTMKQLCDRMKRTTEDKNQ